jgi:hypothetical protein
MTASSLQFKIAQIRQEKLIVVMSSVAVMVFALFVVALLPQLLINFVYSKMKLTEAPELLGQIPAVAFAVVLLDFVGSLINFFRLGLKARKLEKELDSLSMMDESCCANGCNCNGMCMCDDDCNCVECSTDEEMMEDDHNTSDLASALSKKSKTKKAVKARRK